MKLAFVFRTAPHGTSVSREGLDALLAATAFCDENEIAVHFMDDGVLNLLKNQQPDHILQKDYIPLFKLLDLYDIENRYICEQSLQRFSLSEQDLVLNLQKTDRTLLMRQLNQAEKILVF
ncbi:sulfurtransferase complex subunit TusC [Cricetibacter osteomyelitidis]|uniref:sulfurtransferase complex subunit TusC n=1 Tax=Cricetibacter osteomyelitidis TaxID=1521931 RepID=UPI001A9FA414|nr:sulfurtransferase complex subunit TusC [Cricetibacter osteomyelitidis]